MLWSWNRKGRTSTFLGSSWLICKQINNHCLFSQCGIQLVLQVQMHRHSLNCDMNNDYWVVQKVTKSNKNNNGNHLNLSIEHTNQNWLTLVILLIAGSRRYLRRYGKKMPKVILFTAGYCGRPNLYTSLLPKRTWRHASSAFVPPPCWSGWKMAARMR